MSHFGSGTTAPRVAVYSNRSSWITENVSGTHSRNFGMSAAMCPDLR